MVFSVHKRLQGQSRTLSMIISPVIFVKQISEGRQMMALDSIFRDSKNAYNYQEGDSGIGPSLQWANGPLMQSG